VPAWPSMDGHGMPPTDANEVDMYLERFKAWQLVRLRGRGPYGGSAWRVAAHIYRDRAINCMEAMRSYQESIHIWEESYDELEQKNAALRKWLRDLIAVDDEDIDKVVDRMLAPDIEP
jgi:glycine/D-amino acid oxidase-like deaminating enzyme